VELSCVIVGILIGGSARNAGIEKALNNTYSLIFIMEIKCHNCQHEWEYGGNSDFYVTCPKCHYKIFVGVRKNATDSS
jgi:DNA-directed RNA polymerase subunit RPC12/RpoP